jgi:hypothetical protein
MVEGEGNKVVALRTEGGKEVEDLENLFMVIIGLVWLNNRCDHSAPY